MPSFSYSFTQCPDPLARRPRSGQSEAAKRLLAQLRAHTGLGTGPSSKSHSRALVSAAVARDGRVGIDVEALSPARDVLALSRVLLPADPALSARDFYRLWTFREAYYKAFGQFPGLALMRRMRSEGTNHADAYNGGDMQVRFLTIAPAFQLALVWEGDAAAQEIAANSMSQFHEPVHGLDASWLDALSPGGVG